MVVENSVHLVRKTWSSRAWSCQYGTLTIPEQVKTLDVLRHMTGGIVELLVVGSDSKFLKWLFFCFQRHSERVIDYCSALGDCIIRDQRHWRYMLHVASAYGHASAVRKLIERGANVNSFNANNATPLLIAADYGFENCVELLIQHGADPELNDKDGDGALDVASHRGLVGVVEALVKAGANVNRMDRHKKTPLWLSVTRGWYLCVEALLKAPTIQVGHNASFPNMLASLIGNAASSFNPHAAYECTRLLLATGAITAHVVNASQAIHTAAQLGRPKLLELLLSVPGVNINAVQPPSNRAVIHRAVLGNTVELLEYILTVPGLQIDQLTAVGESALVMAIRHFRYDYIDMLLKAGAQTLSVRVPQSPVSVCLEVGDARVLQLLFAHGAKLEDFGVFDEASFLLLAETTRPDVARELFTRLNLPMVTFRTGSKILFET